MEQIEKPQEKKLSISRKKKEMKAFRKKPTLVAKIFISLLIRTLGLDI